MQYLMFLLTIMVSFVAVLIVTAPAIVLIRRKHRKHKKRLDIDYEDETEDETEDEEEEVSPEKIGIAYGFEEQPEDVPKLVAFESHDDCSQEMSKELSVDGPSGEDLVLQVTALESVDIQTEEQEFRTEANDAVENNNREMPQSPVSSQNFGSPGGASTSTGPFDLCEFLKEPTGHMRSSQGSVDIELLESFNAGKVEEDELAISGSTGTSNTDEQFDTSYLLQYECEEANEEEVRKIQSLLEVEVLSTESSGILKTISREASPDNITGTPQRGEDNHSCPVSPKLVEELHELQGATSVPDNSYYQKVMDSLKCSKLPERKSNLVIDMDVLGNVIESPFDSYLQQLNLLMAEPRTHFEWDTRLETDPRDPMECFLLDTKTNAEAQPEAATGTTSEEQGSTSISDTRDSDEDAKLDTVQTAAESSYERWLHGD